MIDKNLVYDLIKEVPKGRVTSYGEIAKKIKSKSYRAIGKIVGQNKNIPEIPCHRVVKADGGIGGYVLGVDKKIAILKSENIEVLESKIVDFKNKLYSFD